MLFYRNIKYTRSTELFLELLDGLPGLLVSSDDRFRDDGGSLQVIALFRLSYVQSVQNALFLLRVLRLLGKSVVKQNVASLALHIVDTIARNVGHLNQISICLLGKVLDCLLRS